MTLLMVLATAESLSESDAAGLSLDPARSCVSRQAFGGDGIFQRIKRVAYDARSTVMVSRVQKNKPKSIIIEYVMFGKKMFMY